MLHAVKGTIYQKGEDYVILESPSGLFFKIIMADPGPAIPGSSVFVHTLLRIKEEQMVLYGFFKEIESKCFEWLTEAPGIGPKTAMQVLRQLTPAELARAVISEQIDVLTSVPGIGQNSAKKMIPYLSSKMKKYELTEEDLPLEEGASDSWAETRVWLMDIGLSASEADHEIREYQKEHGVLPECEILVASILQKRKK
ncbi:MAG TPA: helix-hairpin-helix domain-containing protein [Caldisericia bacterium]|nr:helix-hairpin-helix domain-containing protein [Caldisericia bacterium]